MIYKRIVRPVLFWITRDDPEKAHHLSLAVIPALTIIMEWWRPVLFWTAMALLFWVTPWWLPTAIIAVLLLLAYASRPTGAWAKAQRRFIEQQETPND